ncbi:MAG: DUF1674 domain-containing protein [Alphaproteobacteria bacterium]|nr:DUF1674 domain-containing protein [Alphaproteobacteria bacterium]|tara:strand:- start:2505 stop:2681 length:177 start_codon:yes stop_codon:yes gene_type:complete
MSDKNPSLSREEKQKTLPADAGKEGEAPADEKGGFRDAGLKEPTRYGDWDVKGRCSDF